MKHLIMVMQLLVMLMAFNVEAAEFKPGHMFAANFSAFTDPPFSGSSVIEFRITASGVEIVKEFGSGAVSGPGGMAFGGPNGHLYVSNIIEFFNGLGGTITEFSADGSVVRNVRVVDCAGPPDASPDCSLRGIVFGPNGNLFVSVRIQDKILELDRNTLSLVRSIEQPAGSTPRLVGPGGIAFDSNGFLFITGQDSGTIVGLDVSGEDIVEVSNFPVNPPSGPVERVADPLLRAIAFDRRGNLYVSVKSSTSTTLEGSVAVFAPGGALLGIIAGPGNGVELNPGGINFGPNGHLFVGSEERADATGKIQEFSVTINQLFVGVDSDLVVEWEAVRAITRSEGKIDPRFVVFAPSISKAIPTLSTWAITLLVALIVWVGIVSTRRRQLA